MKIDNSPPRGTRDLLPDASAVRDRVLAKIANVYHGFGYHRIETPALESIERLAGGQGGDNEKLIFQILRRGLPNFAAEGTPIVDLVDLGLRYDLTVPLARFYGNNHSRLANPFRSFQFGPVWRAERPQKGRYRQFYQCDIDFIGEPAILAEAELIEATTQALAAVGLANIVVRLSDRRFLAELARIAGVPDGATGTYFVVLDKLDKIGIDGVHSQLIERGFSEAAATKTLDTMAVLSNTPQKGIVQELADLLPASAGDLIADLNDVTECLDDIRKSHACGGGELDWRFDPTLVRGMGYYTGQIFEISHNGMHASIAGGGRYDRLIGRSLQRDVPACGFSIGFERIVDLLSHPVDADRLAILYEDSALPAAVLSHARRLRAAGRMVSVIRRQGKFGAQLDRLASWGFTSVAILGEDGDAEERPLKPSLR